MTVCFVTVLSYKMFSWEAFSNSPDLADSSCYKSLNMCFTIFHFHLTGTIEWSTAQLLTVLLNDFIYFKYSLLKLLINSATHAIKKFPHQIEFQRLISELTFFWFSSEVCPVPVEYSCPAWHQHVMWSGDIYSFFGGGGGRWKLYRKLFS
jgi:hypothetical protein